MGRTLHYDIKKDNGSFTKKEVQTITDISKKYNSGKFKDVWTCENFYANPYDYFPNWGKFEQREKGWDIVAKLFAEGKKKGEDEITTTLRLKKEGYINFHDASYKTSCHGFVKVQGNEFNAYLVYYILLEISKALKSVTITLSDEGSFLYLPVIMKGGKVNVDFQDYRETINELAAKVAMSNDGNKIIKPKNIPDELMNDFGFNNYRPLKDLAESLNEHLGKLNDIFLKINSKLTAAPYIYNLKQMYFDDVAIFHRKVDPKDFTDVKVNVGTLMAGFYGEYYGLNGNVDPEAESYRMIANVQKVLPKGTRIKVLPKI